MREKTNLTLHPSVKKAAVALAQAQGRSLSELVERLLEREVEKGGRLSMQEHPEEATVELQNEVKQISYRKKQAF